MHIGRCTKRMPSKHTTIRDVVKSFGEGRIIDVREMPKDRLVAHLSVASQIGRCDRDEVALGEES